MNLMYKKAVIGGTFDHLHLGHKKLIDTAFELSEQVIVGLAKPSLYKNKFFNNTIEDYFIREQNLKSYLIEKNFINHSTIISITDIYGPTITDESIEGIFVTEENIQNLVLINKKREEIGFSSLKSFVVPLVKTTDEKIITSERIRRGEIDRDGFVYKNVFSRTLILPDYLRPTLQKPIGQVVRNTKELLKLKILGDKPIVIAVGDVIVNELKKVGIEPAISIIDFKTQRQSFLPKSLGVKLSHPWGGMSRHLRINEPGTINRDATDEINMAIDNYLKTQKPQTVTIDGEEDLLALPAILLAPLASIVAYGQFGKGIVLNEVTGELKHKVLKLIQQFGLN